MRYFGFDKPSFGFKTFGFGSSDDAIKALFTGGKQGIWLDPSDLTTLFQDAAGTIPVTKDGDPVALMRDKSGNGNHATQSVSAARPIYKTNEILHWLEFDGVDDYLITAPTLTLSSGFVASMGIAINQLSSSTSTIRLFGIYSGINQQVLYVRSDSARELGVISRSESNNNKQISNKFIYEIGEKLVFTGWHDNVIGKLLSAKSSNTLESGDVSVTTQNAVPIIVGGTVNFNFYGGLFLVNNSNDRSKVEAYLAAKAGVTL